MVESVAMRDGAKRVERRTFLCVMGAAGVAASAMAGCGGDDPPAPFSAGRVADHPVGVWKLFAGQQVIVGRDAGGYFAYSTRCTHQGTPVEFRQPGECAAPTGCTAVSTTGITRCPAHFTTYDGNGTVITGSTGVPLPHYQVTVAGGEITVNPGAVVTADVRATGA